MRALKNKDIYRIIDANTNRAKEGLRVCEDICRFVLDATKETRACKRIRHAITAAVSGLSRRELLACRESTRDVGTRSIDTELVRRSIPDIFYANMQRVKESVRVLEECLKLHDRKKAEALKRQRYALYTLEKTISPRL